jgi:copper chaperone CopZ
MSAIVFFVAVTFVQQFFRRTSMRSFVIWTFIASLAMVGAGCQSTSSNSPSKRSTLDESISKEPNSATMWVHGMGCPQCAYNVDLQLLKVPGVENVKVDMGSGQVVAKLSPENPPTKEQLSTAIENTGFTLKKIEIR